MEGNNNAGRYGKKRYLSDKEEGNFKTGNRFEKEERKFQTRENYGESRGKYERKNTSKLEENHEDEIEEIDEEERSPRKVKEREEQRNEKTGRFRQTRTNDKKQSFLRKKKENFEQINFGDFAQEEPKQRLYSKNENEEPSPKKTNRFEKKIKNETKESEYVEEEPIERKKKRNPFLEELDDFEDGMQKKNKKNSKQFFNFFLIHFKTNLEKKRNHFLSGEFPFQ